MDQEIKIYVQESQAINAMIRACDKTEFNMIISHEVNDYYYVFSKRLVILPAYIKKENAHIYDFLFEQVSHSYRYTDYIREFMSSGENYLFSKIDIIEEFRIACERSEARFANLVASIT